MTANLDSLFKPRSVTVVGASGRAESPYSLPVRYLTRFGFEGPVYPVNPSYKSIEGARCYPTIDSIGEELDLVISIRPAEDTEEVLREAAGAGAKSLVVLASGFADAGLKGRSLEENLVQTANEHEVCLIGPNCQGIIYGPSRLTATFTVGISLGLPREDGIAYLGQSGAVGGAVLDLARESGTGLTAWVSTGNEAQTDLIALGRHLVEDDAIQVLMLYMESAKDGSQYIRLAREARERGKHLVVLRAGRSQSGKRAVASHTGSLLGPDAAFDLASADEGVVVVDDVKEMLRVGHALRWLPPARGPRVAVVSSSGGAASLAADQFEQQGMELNELSPPAKARLNRMLPEFAGVSNPVDVTAALFSRNDDSFRRVAELVGKLDEVDVLVVVATMFIGRDGIDLARSLQDLREELGKPVFIVWMTGETQNHEGRTILRAAHLPLFDSVSEAARCCSAFVRRSLYAEHSLIGLASDRLLSGEVLANLDEAVLPGTVLEANGQIVLDVLGVRRPAGRLAQSALEAKRIGKELGGRLVLKLQAEDLLHKADFGGVELDVAPASAGEVFADLVARYDSRGMGGFEGVLVQQQAPPGIEMLVGVTRSQSNFPSLLTVGFGGTNAEIDPDTASALLPVDRDRVANLLRSLRGWPRLTAHRGVAESDTPALIEAIIRIADGAVHLGGALMELEVNPLVVHPIGKGVTAVDFLMRNE
jgi:acyl-CoA synthetase (NDP forming)